LYEVEQYPSWGKGTFVTSAAISIADLRRGSSNTIVVSERVRGEFPEGYVTDGEIWLSGMGVVLGGMENATAEQLRDVAFEEYGNNPEPAVITAGYYWWFWDYRDSLYNHAARPNEPLTGLLLHGSSQARIGQVDGGLIGATSRHPGIVVATSADGAVKAVSESIDLALWREMANRN
jgi:hypothetical protein